MQIIPKQISICHLLILILRLISTTSNKNRKYQGLTKVPKYIVPKRHNKLNNGRLLLNIFDCCNLFLYIKFYNSNMSDKIYVCNKTIIRGKLISIARTYVLVAFDGNVGICHISNISDYLVKDITDFFNYDKEYDFLLISDDGNGKYNLSYKAIHPKFLKKHKDVIETPSGFKTIKDDLERRLKDL